MSSAPPPDGSAVRRWSPRVAVAPMAVGVATVLFLILFLRHLPCVRTSEAPFDRYLLACYSDIQVFFLDRGLGAGASPTEGELTVAPLLAVLTRASALLASALGGPTPAAPSAQEQVDASVGFFGVTTVLLFGFFLAAVVAMLSVGRGGDGRRSTDALLLAASPVVLAVGLINWELVPWALTLVALALFGRGQPIGAGIVFGLALGAGEMPFAVLAAVLVACGLRGGARRVAEVAIPAAATFAALLTPFVLRDVDRVLDRYLAALDPPTGFGSLWYLAHLWGFDVKHAGALAVSAVLLFLGCVFGFLRATGKRPRVGSLVGLAILASVVLAPSFPPQTGLWVLLAVLLARPYRLELILVTVTQVGYTLAVWGWIDGALTTRTGGPYWLYWAALIARVAVEAWVLLRIVVDLLWPHRDRFPEPDPLRGRLGSRARRARVAAAAQIEQPDRWWPRWRPAIVASAVAVLVTRAVFLLAAYAAQWLLTTDQVKPSFSLQPWVQWDAYHYLDIAAKGYGPEIVGGNAPAFFPFFPLAVRYVSALGIEPVTAGVLISAVSSFVACVYTYRLAQLHGFQPGNSALYLLLFPTGVFLVAPYTEALFLAGAVPAFYYAYRGRAWPAAAFAAVAVGTRTVGMIVVVGVAFELARTLWPRRGKLVSAAVAMAAATVPFWAFGLHLQRVRGSFFQFMTAQKEGWGRDFVGFADGFLATLRTWDGDYGANIIFTWRLEIVFALLSLALLVWLMWRGYVGYALYVGATLIIALGNAWYYSNPRLALAFFPFAFALAALVGRRERVHTYVVLGLTALVAVGVVAYTRSAWFF